MALGNGRPHFLHTYPVETVALAFSAPPQPGLGQRWDPLVFGWPGSRFDPPSKPNAIGNDVAARASTYCSRTNSANLMGYIPPTRISMAALDSYAIAPAWFLCCCGMSCDAPDGLVSELEDDGHAGNSLDCPT